MLITVIIMVMTTAMTVLHEARSGKDFAELARQYSDDPAAKGNGGDLGTFRKGDKIGRASCRERV